MELIQQGYIKILSPLGKLNSEKNRKIRYFLIGVCFFFIFGTAFLSEVKEEFLFDDSFFIVPQLRFFATLTNTGIAFLGGSLLAIILLLGVEGELKVKMWNWYVAVLWFLFNSLFMISGAFHDIGEGFLVSEIFIFFLIPAFYIVWTNNGRLLDLYEIMSASLVILGMIFCFVNFIWFHYGDLVALVPDDSGQLVETVLNTMFEGTRYMGVASHPNRAGIIATVTTVACLFTVFRKKGAISVIAAVTYGSLLSIVSMAASRTAIVAIVLTTAVFLIIWFKDGKTIKQLAVAVLIAVLSFFVTYSVINEGNDNLSLFSYDNTAESSYAAQENANDAETEEPDESILQKRFQYSSTLNKLSSGRIGLWMAFGSELNLVGHDARYSYPLIIRDPDTGVMSLFSNPHNLIIDYAYRAGIPTAAVALILELLAILFSLAVIFSRKKPFPREAAFTALVTAAFFVSSNLEAINFPFTRVLLLVYYLALIPVFGIKCGND